MKKFWWIISWSKKSEGGFYQFKGTEAQAKEEVEKLKARFKANGKRPKITLEISE